MGSCSPLFVLAVVLIGIPFGINEAKLAYDYYKYSCPNLETIVRREMLSIFLTDATAPAAFLQLMFHDCLVQVRKRETIGYIKSILENECPGKVSCADIIALAAKKSVSFSGGPHIQIPLGRKDSTTSSYQQADASLPPQGIKVHELIHTFASKGMNLEEAIAIIGAHTLGVGHCMNIASRLYDPQPHGHMHYGYEAFLRLKCPTRVPITNFTFVPNDITPTIFDNQYYRDVLMGKGLFTIDSSISTDPRTAPIVRHFAIDQNYFFQVFSSAFVKLSSTNVLTKGKGEVRRQCNRININ
ncbi:hypothetical protein SO802_007399 [Lithocarpus litseifolius]|uniref:Peroxidase n=1 Tax=Lithocarpus litseifolius TaxID=425828 RepID=A0AAW2DU66_9ROSI